MKLELLSMRFTWLSFWFAFANLIFLNKINFGFSFVSINISEIGYSYYTNIEIANQDNYKVIVSKSYCFKSLKRIKYTYSGRYRKLRSSLEESYGRSFTTDWKYSVMCWVDRRFNNN